MRRKSESIAAQRTAGQVNFMIRETVTMLRQEPKFPGAPVRQ